MSPSPTSHSQSHTIRGATPALRERPAPMRADPLSCWLVLLGVFLVVNGGVFVSGARHQVHLILMRHQSQQPQPQQQPDQTRPAWLERLRPMERLHALIGGSSTCVESDDVLTSMTEHITQTLGATYVSLGLLTICLAMTPRRTRRFAAFALVVWSTIQVLLSTPKFLGPVEASNRSTFHLVVIFLTTTAACLSSLREPAELIEKRERL